MENEKKVAIINFFLELLNVYEFSLEIDVNSDSENIFKLKDIQGGNLGGIEQEEFLTLGDILERMDAYHNDYIYNSLQERESSNEKILKDEWDLTAKRYLESNTVAKILTKIQPKDYLEILNNSKNSTLKDMLKILNEDEQFYKDICRKYVKTMSKEMLLETNDKILHIFIEDEYIPLKENGKITIENYKDYLDSSFETYEYNFYQDLYNSTIKDEIAYDLNDLELFNNDGKWNFYISFEELKKMGYGFMVKDHYPLIEKYAIPDEKVCEFFDYFTLEELENFENSLDLYFTQDVIYNQEYDSLESREGYSFDRGIIRLACGLITYEDFISDYKESPLTIYDICLSKVAAYFKENDIKDLLNYGSDRDEGLYHLSSLYEEIMNKLNINCKDIYTEDGISDGKYITTITFNDNSQIVLDTSAWNGIKVVTENMEFIYEQFNKSLKNTIENEMENEIAY